MAPPESSDADGTGGPHGAARPGNLNMAAILALRPSAGQAAPGGIRVGYSEAMSGEAPDHAHLDDPDHPHNAPLSDVQLRVRALESLLTEKGLVDPAALEQDEVELMLQINGKLRGALRVPAGADKAEIEKLAVASEGFAKFAEGQAIKRVIVVPGRLVNVVVG